MDKIAEITLNGFKILELSILNILLFRDGGPVGSVNKKTTVAKCKCCFKKQRHIFGNHFHFL